MNISEVESVEEFTKGVVEEYLAYQRRVLNTLLDRGVYTQEGIDDHIRCLRETIEEDLDSNKAYALLKMEMDVKKGIRDEEKEYVSLTHIARQKNFENPSYVIQSWLRDRNTLDVLYLWEIENNPNFRKDGYESIINKLSNPSFTLTAKIWKEETGATGIISKQGNGGGTFAHEDIAIDFYAWTFPQKRYQLVKIISGKAAFLDLIHEDLESQKKRYNNMSEKELYASQGITLVDKFGE